MQPGGSLSTPAAEVIRALVARGQTLAVAEACTGGLVGHLLTEVPGSSAVFLGGVIAYDNRLKERIGVPAAVLRAEGAVSEATARALGEAVRRWSGADIGLAVTGIAGPGGATAAKPVGLAYVALTDGVATVCERHTWSGSRTANKAASAEAAIDLLLGYLRTAGPG